jgi:hypothetical protein
MSERSSDELDQDYDSRHGSSLVYVTPGHYADRTASLSTDAKNAVMSKSHTPQRCFVTLENAPRSVIDVCHFIPKATKAPEVGLGLLLITCFLSTSLGPAFGTGV